MVVWPVSDPDGVFAWTSIYPVLFLDTIVLFRHQRVMEKPSGGRCESEQFCGLMVHTEGPQPPSIVDGAKVPFRTQTLIRAFFPPHQCGHEEKNLDYQA